MTRLDIDVQVVDDLDGLEGIAAQWKRTQDACNHVHVLLDHRFVTAWWRHLGGRHSMHTLVLRRGDVPVGIAPLMVSSGWEVFPTRGRNVRIAEDFDHLPTSRFRRLVPIRRLGFPLSFASSNIRAHLVAPRVEREHAEAVLSYCLGIRDRWDILSLDGIPQGSDQERQLCDAAERLGLRRTRARHARTFLQTSLPSSMDAFLAHRSGNFRRWLRRSIRQSRERCAALGELHIQEYRGTSLDEGMDRLFALERQSWKAARARRRDLHLSLDDRHRNFYRDVARSFAAEDEAQVLVTEVGGRAVSAMCSLQRRDTITCLLTYQAENLKDRVSVAPLWARFFEIVIGRGLERVDFNGNNEYLARYADRQTRVSRLVFHHAGTYSSLLRRVADGATLVSRALSRD